MTLESFEVLPRGSSGWTSGALPFGRTTTLLLGGNGTGKTPIMRALAFVLGQPVQLPPLVTEKCAGARLVLVDGERRYSIERSFLDAGVAKIRDGDTQWQIAGAKEFSEFLLPKLGLSLRSLAGKNGQVTPPYLGIVGPMFIVDQDSGWLSGYVPNEAHQFIKDQREEVLRWVLDLPPRNRAVDKTEYDNAQVHLESIQQQIRVKRDALAALDTALGQDRGNDSLERLMARKVELEAEFSAAFDTVNELGQGADELDANARLIGQSRREISFKLINLKRRRTQLAGVQTELGAEIGALEQNETAAETFRLFCGNAACQLFRKPEESYGRRVLYLKDQLKDFESNAGEVEREIDLLELQLSGLEREVRVLADDRRSRLAASGAAAALERLQGLSREVTALQIRIDSIGRVESMRAELEDLLSREQRAAEIVADLKPTRGPRKTLGRVLDARARLAETFTEWMVVLRTPNVSLEVTFDEELRPLIGGEPFGSASSQSGSTRTRLVLAFHASVLQTSAEMGGVHPPLLVLDAPRQHELSASDLRAFVERFFEMARPIRLNAPQLVFSASDPEVVPEGCIDALWPPTFKFGDNLRFLGPIEDRRA